VNRVGSKLDRCGSHRPLGRGGVDATDGRVHDDSLLEGWCGTCVYKNGGGDASREGGRGGKGRNRD
jgi:hypothetical protein